MEALLRFDDRVAVVTGGGRGLGRAHALLLAARGAKVVVNNPTVDPGIQVVEEIVSSGGEAVVDHSDVSVSEQAEAIIQKAIDVFGRVDILVNNAGIAGDNEFGSTSLEFFERFWRINAAGHFNVARAAWPHMKSRGYGRIINTTSGAGIYGIPTFTAYGSSKGAINGLTRALALEGQPLGILVNAISPGALTRQTEHILTNEPARAAQWLEMRSELVSPAVAWLAHESCTSNGEIYEVFAGRIARVLLAETKGLFHPELTPELIRDNQHVLADEEGYFVPENARDVGAFAAENRVLAKSSGEE
jgi:NAD(P)-dependent dehydrogenase (short-subunit alcohol dehydrogenase family)